MGKRIAIFATVVFALIGAGAIWLFVAFWRDMERGEQHARQAWADRASGKAYFEGHPALFAVAQAIAANNPDAIRANAKALPDLNAPGIEGATLLYFAVSESWQKPQLVESVKTLLSLGADPNFNNGHPNSFAMAAAVHSTVDVLRVMLDAGGNPNGHDEFDRPIICQTWYLGYYKDQARARAALLLDRGADINSIMPERDDSYAGYSLLLYRLRSGPEDPEAFADAQFLLERGADPNLSSRSGMTFAKMMEELQAQPRIRGTPQFRSLWEMAIQRGLVRPT
jgi:ankyrin repeat protein